MRTSFRRFLLLSIAGAALVLPLTLGTPAAAVDAASPVIVLHLVTAHPKDEYGDQAESSDLSEVSEAVRHGVAENLPGDEVTTKAAGGCGDSTCARAIGKKVGAHTIVFGTVENEIGVRWIAHIYALDVPTGRMIDSVAFAVIGNFDALSKTLPKLAACLGGSIAGKPRCKTYEPTNEHLTKPIISE
ncbi:MAG: hypothetical protein IAI50_05920 [Candidatus Eremiobacteraeota bacterium]|nr:hypothetical protein [Candidatus Eremiobacteraeota bacterium]